MIKCLLVQPRKEKGTGLRRAGREPDGPAG